MVGLQLASEHIHQDITSRNLKANVSYIEFTLFSQTFHLSSFWQWHHQPLVTRAKPSELTLMPPAFTPTSSGTCYVSSRFCVSHLYPVLKPASYPGTRFVGDPEHKRDSVSEISEEIVYHYVYCN